jgi:hypothetical protein
MPLLDQFGAAWAGYRAAHHELRQAIEERL